MKTMKLFRLMTITAIVAVGLIFSLSNCKREKEIVVVNVHDTLRGKDVSGLVTYPGYDNAIINADGAVLSLYAGSSATGSPVATAYADVTGNYTFKYLLPGTYFITGTFNTANLNNKGLQGVTFVTNPGYPVTMGSANLTQNVDLVTSATAGTLKICLTADTLANPGFLPVGMESHSKISFVGMHNMNQQDLPGGFNVLKFSKFIFDEANPGNIVIDSYVLASSINTLEPSRDAIGTGCVARTMGCDTLKPGGVITNVALPDTFRFYTNAGEVVKYGKGYLAHGHMKAFYKHGLGLTRPNGSTIPADTSYLQNADGIPYNQYIDKPVDMYFEYQYKKLQGTGATAKWIMVFEGTFTFNKWTGWYVKSTSISDIIKVDAHIGMQGLNGRTY